jgi:hypothetical protein
VSDQPSDEHPGHSRSDDHDPDWSLGVANCVSNTNVIPVVHTDQYQADHDRGYEQPAKQLGGVASVDRGGVFTYLVTHVSSLHVRL